MLRARERVPFFLLFVVSLWDPHLGFLRSWGRITHHTHANEQDIKIDYYKSLNLKCFPFHILVHH
jgi:hypothetical protein